MTASWPDWCCVAAIVDAVLVRFEIQSLQQNLLAQGLGVKAASRADNELSLPVAASMEDAGVGLHEFERRFRKMANLHAWDVRFRFVPFSAVHGRDYEGAFDQVSSRGEFVALGLNWPTLFDSEQIFRHLVELKTFREAGVAVVDHTRLNRNEQQFKTIDVERAVRMIDGGFWVFENGVAP